MLLGHPKVCPAPPWCPCVPGSCGCVGVAGMGFVGYVGGACGVVPLDVRSCLEGEGVPPVGSVSGELGLSSVFFVPCVSILHTMAVRCFVGSMVVAARGSKSRRSGW